VGLALAQGRPERDELLRSIAAAGFSIRDMTDNEMAKLHVRYMVGGQARGLTDERLYRFEFPERPGALLSFLRQLSGRWSITLFHYRNHGAAFGRVLAGIQVAEGDRAGFDAALESIGYAHRDESNNPAYALFLGEAP